METAVMPNYSATTILARALAYVLAGVVGIGLAIGVFYVVFFFPAWFTNENILLGWGWIGTPIGFLLGVATLMLVTQRLGAFVAEVVTPLEDRRVTREARAATRLSEATATAIASALTSLKTGAPIDASCPICRSHISAKPFSAAARRSPIVLECQCKACSGTFVREDD